MKDNPLRRWLVVCGAALFLAVRADPILAEPWERAVDAEVKAGADIVNVGLYVIRIHEVNLKEQYFRPEFYVWFRWRNKELHPYKSFSVINAREVERDEPAVKDLASGERYAYVRLVARVSTFLDVREFPLDGHELTVDIEEDEYEQHLVRYVADSEQSGAERSISVPGWTLTRVSTADSVRAYRSNFGDTSIGDEARYSRVSLTMQFARAGPLYFMKLFFGLWVAAGISFLAFFIRPLDVDPRFGMGVAAIFAAIASEYIVTASFPETNVITLADKLHLVTFGFVFCTLAQSTWSLKLAEQGREAASRKLDELSRWAFPLAYVVVNALLIVFRR